MTGSEAQYTEHRTQNPYARVLLYPTYAGTSNRLGQLSDSAEIRLDDSRKSRHADSGHAESTESVTQGVMLIHADSAHLRRRPPERGVDELDGARVAAVHHDLGARDLRVSGTTRSAFVTFVGSGRSQSGRSWPVVADQTAYSESTVSTLIFYQTAILRTQWSHSTCFRANQTNVGQVRTQSSHFPTKSRFDSSQSIHTRNHTF